MPWTVGRQAPPSTGFPRQEYWRGLSFSPPGESSRSRTKPTSLALADEFLTTALPGKPNNLQSVGEITELIFGQKKNRQPQVLISSEIPPVNKVTQKMELLGRGAGSEICVQSRYSVLLKLFTVGTCF